MQEFCSRYNVSIVCKLEIKVEDEAILVMLVRQYADKFGITFDSKFLDDPDKKQHLIKLIQEAVAGKRGPVTNEDLN
jgi:hypothetical protein